MVIDKGSPLLEAMDERITFMSIRPDRPALKKGEPYPDETVFLIDLHGFTVSDGSDRGRSTEATAIMPKDNKKYAATGGWGLPGLGGR